jgi:hypothetical protein
MAKGATMLFALWATACSGSAKFSPRAGFTPEKEGAVLNLTLDKNTRTIAIDRGDLDGVTVEYLRTGDFDPLDLELSRVEGRLKLIQGIPGDFGLRVASRTRFFGQPLFITLPIKGLDSAFTVAGYAVNDDGTLSPCDMIGIDRKNGTATFSLSTPLVLVWARVRMDE